MREIKPDVVFNALHGTGGEDGTIQGVLEWLGIPYTGSDLTSCALAMDKHLTKKLLAAEGLPTPAWDTFDLAGGTLPLLPGSLNLPLVVKPRASGSSAGVSIVRTHEEWTKAMINVAPKTTQILAEEFIPGREFSSGVLGEEALPLVEIIASDEFYSLRREVQARRLAPSRAGADRRRSHRAPADARALGASAARACATTRARDFIVTKEGRPYILEINALPGLTPLSLLPDEARAAGISFEALIERLLQFALGRAVLV